MAGCSPFDIDFQGDAQQLLDRLRARISDAGGQLQGNAKSGTFWGNTVAGPIRGTYQVSTSFITIYIDEKPSLVPCSMIEARIREYVR